MTSAESILKKILTNGDAYVDWVQYVEDNKWKIREPRLLIIDGHINMTDEEVEFIEKLWNED